MSGYWHWVPGTSIGPFTFREWAKSYIEDYGLRKKRPDCSLADWETYEFPGFESLIVVDKGRIIEVHCADEIEYQGKNIIGMPSSDVRNLLGEEDTTEEGVGLGYALYYDRLGLTLFVVNEVVSAAACGLILTDEDDSGSTFLPIPHA